MRKAAGVGAASRRDVHIVAHGTAESRRTFPAPSPLRRAMMARFAALLDARRGRPAAAHHRAMLCRPCASCCASIVRRRLAGVRAAVRPRALVRRARFSWRRPPAGRLSGEFPAMS
ncbi:hypothetical protein F511_46539 [Dorcoceras hygrometricum]|uniref:Uncharacterized protein n=1 Tax=Dorcoceras hygrometricum TaxID=472368 RepID=A0A2Z6ZTB7_9LAMI|nr:hypothetical protein F511_46539 [Dorcoceras hygrometricum]